MPDPRFKHSNTQSCRIEYGDLVFNSIENFYQAMKTTDYSERQKVSRMTWQEAKAYCSKPELTGRRSMQEWDGEDDDGLKMQVMEYALRIKYSPGTPRARLLAFDDSDLRELNTWHDQVWGDCTCWQKPGKYGVREECRKPGKNRLQQILLKIREELRQTIYVN